MKKVAFILLFIFFNHYANAQLAVVNDKLMLQLEKNQEARKLSNNRFIENYEKAKEIYEDASKKSAEIMAIHEMIYNQLYNVNELFTDVKRMKYFYESAQKIFKYSKKVIELSAKYPQYAVWLHKHYQAVYPQAIALQNELQEKVLKPNKKLLMDAYDRDLVISEIQSRMKLIELSLLTIIIEIEFSQSRAYINSIPVLGDYYNQDKDIVKDVIYKVKKWKHY
ncbi:hypothetical protein EDM00_09575 [Ornithobacterium rhinotracheale]|uniref:hypothetical protein n=1 Tax=Ornithobacterium rhinotracheale TaxID=28251 RepID=UPI00129CDA16|nr:hypothetical protein [Ornithobacterium rhinotracheale]MRI64237.1 hypothetical protein [Ornithobacterium rhinotracheale]